MQTPYKAPAFKLKDESGKTYSLADFKGKWVVLYFYPKDDTPGCTVEACSLRDTRDELTKLGAEVVGISRDDAAAHEKFKAKYNLNFTLLTDPDAEVTKLYEAWGKNRFGKIGVLRKTFIIDPTGKIQKVYGKVVPLGHGDKVVSDLASLLEQI